MKKQKFRFPGEDGTFKENIPTNKTGGALFFFGTFFMPPRKNSQIFMPPCFIPPLKFLCHPFLCQPPILKCLYHNFLCHLDYLCVQEKFEIQRYTSTFLTPFLFGSPFYYVTFFNATFKKIEILMPPSKFIPPCKKNNGEAKNQKIVPGREKKTVLFL